jgi:hypothetical protein
VSIIGRLPQRQGEPFVALALSSAEPTADVQRKFGPPLVNARPSSCAPREWQVHLLSVVAHDEVRREWQHAGMAGRLLDREPLAARAGRILVEECRHAVDRRLPVEVADASCGRRGVFSQRSASWSIRAPTN